MSKDIVEQKSTSLQAGAEIVGIVPRNLDEAWKMADAFIRAGMVPFSYEGKTVDETCAKLMMGIMQGLEIGIAPITALKNIAIINNRPTIWGDLAIALVQNSGVLVKMEVIQDEEPDGEMNHWPASYGVTVRLHRRDQETPYEGRFTVGDAKRAGLWLNSKKQPWMQYPKRMLKWRALGFAIRDGFADCLAGMMIREEVEDMPHDEPEKKADVGFLDDEPVLIEAKDIPSDPEEIAVAVQDDEAEPESVIDRVTRALKENPNVFKVLDHPAFAKEFNAMSPTDKVTAAKAAIEAARDTKQLDKMWSHEIFIQAGKMPDKYWSEIQAAFSARQQTLIVETP